ncbi:MAG: thioredoxin [Bacteroidaceae bacterium]|nr:thioredoxin [Bacteroidaceae bacterium]
MESFNEIINGEQPTLVDFFATWCIPCKQMHPVLDKLKESLGDKIRIIKIDIDKNETLTATYNIQSVPTFMLFHKGEAVWRQSGAMRLNELKALLDPFLKK